MATADTSFVDAFRSPAARPALLRWWSALSQFCLRKPLGGFGLLILVLVLFFGAFSPWLAKDGPNTVHLGEQFTRPNATYWLGTDQNGRDIYSRIIYGAQVTALVGVGTVLLTGFLSLVVGVLSGYFSGKVDFTIQRFVDVWMSFPAIFLIITLVAVLTTGTSRGFFGLGHGPEIGPNPQDGSWFWYTFPRTTIVILVLGVVLAGGTSRVVRGSVFSVMANPYIEAARVVGADNIRIMLKHVVPNIMPIVIVLATVQLGVAVLAEATLSFLGIGITNFPTWGQMIGDTAARAQMARHPHIVLAPGIAIFLAVFGFNMLGDALRDVLDPRLRGSR